MYKCNNCNNTFEEPRTYNENHPYGLTCAPEEFGDCPHCGDSDIEPARRCDKCGEYAARLNNGYCEDCIEWAKKFYSESIGKEFVHKTPCRIRDFYFIFLYGIVNFSHADEKDFLIDCAKNHPNYKQALKEFCLEDGGEWADFVVRYAESEAAERKVDKWTA